MLKETIILIGLCCFSSTARIHAQQEASPFHTVGETQKKKVRTMVEVLTDTTVQDSLEEDIDMHADSAATEVPLMVALPLKDIHINSPGTVTDAGSSTAGGNYITIDYGICTCSFLHLSKIDVKRGQHVKAGQKIAISGNTGKRTTGPHLHLLCKWSDTGKYFDPRILLKFITEQLKKLKIP